MRHGLLALGEPFGILRVLWDGMCTAQRFHMEGEEQRCRAGGQDEPDSLSHYNECPATRQCSSRLYYTDLF